MRMFLFVACLLLASNPVLSAQISAISANKVGQERIIKRLILQLRNPDYETREKAAWRLKQLGDAAKPQLEQAAEGDDRNIQLGAARVLSLLHSNDFTKQKNDLAKRIRAFQNGTGTLPGWDRFQHLINFLPEYRHFFSDMYREHALLLDAYEAHDYKAGELLDQFYSACLGIEKLGELTSYLEERDRQILLASLLLIAGDKRSGLPERAQLKLCDILHQLHPANNFYETFGWANVPGDPIRNIMRQLVDVWLEQPSGTGAPDLAYQKMRLMVKLAEHGQRKKNLTPLIEVAIGCDSAIAHRLEAVLGMGVWGTLFDRQLIEVLRSLVDEGSENEGNTSAASSLRDWALASLVHLSGQRIEDYGFSRAEDLRRFFENQVSSPPDTSCFETSQKREQAFTQWDVWARKNTHSNNETQNVRQPTP